MQNLIVFEAAKFQARAEELDENNDNFINPGLFGKSLSRYLWLRLRKRGYKIAFACIEDWGSYHEIAHDAPFKLTFGCSNYEGGHLVQIHPRQDYVRKIFKKYHARPKVIALRDAIFNVLEGDPEIKKLHLESS